MEVFLNILGVFAIVLATFAPWAISGVVIALAAGPMSRCIRARRCQNRRRGLRIQWTNAEGRGSCFVCSRPLNRSLWKPGNGQKCNDCLHL